MKVLQKTLLASVAGGEADEVVFAYGGGDTGTWDGEWGGGSDAGWDGGGDYGGGSSAIAAPGFDSNGVGSNSCVQVPPSPASGLFGYSFTESLTLGGGLSGGVGASLAIEAIGGWSAIGSLGAGAAPLTAAAGAGLFSAGFLGWGIGTAIYHNSETVQDLSQKAWGGVFQVIEDVSQGAADLLEIDRTPHPVYHP